jgi:diguanylate cyclase (GGDEF)-like protein
MPVSMLMIDIDRFKQVNDTLGHQAGDDVLAKLCERIKGRLRQSDLFSRFGGEEFVVVLPDTEPRDARRVAESVREVVSSQPMRVAGQDMTVTISIGVRTIRPVTADAGAAEQLILDSDAAMYRAKRAGRNRVEVFRMKQPSPA